jgi:hypothetical protein
MVTRWVETGALPMLVDIEESGLEGPRPWQVSELVVEVGKRTLVATTEAHRGRLPSLLAEAEQAAAVADRYAVDGSPPDRYRIYYAGKAEWRKWYGGDAADWVAGYAVPVGGGHYELVVNSADLHRTYVDDLLRHELAHAASMADTVNASHTLWWLMEGIAEHAAAGNRSLSRYEHLSDVEQLLREDGWDGELASLEPGENDPDWKVGAGYGIGYLAVRHLMERFGERQVMEFFKLVVHDRRPLEEASRRIFDADWPTLHDDCVSYIREAVS